MGKALHQDTLQPLEKDIRPDITPPTDNDYRKKESVQSSTAGLDEN